MKGLAKNQQASETTETLNLGGHNYQLANLLESGIVMRSRLLIAVSDRWHQIDATKYKLPDSNLQAFKTRVETAGLRLRDFGIEGAEKETGDSNLHHADFMNLQDQFPPFTYLEICRYDTYYKKLHGRPMGAWALRRDLKIIQQRGLSIDDWIAWKEAQKNQIINNVKSKFLSMSEIPTVQEEQRKKMLTDRGFEYNEPDQCYTLNLGPTANFSVSLQSIVDDNVEDWNEMLDNIDASLNEATPTPKTSAASAPVAENPSTDQAKAARPPVSLEVFGNMKADRVAELAGLEEKQKAIVAANPFVKITDAATLKTAKASKAILLKASTETEKIETNASKYLNTFKTMIKNVVTPAAKITRDAHQKQADEITRHENAEAIRLQAEQQAKLQKIKDRSDKLFAVPFGFDGQIYSIGNVYITPTQIETMSDADFDAEIAKGVTAKNEADAAAERDRAANQSKDDALRLAAKTLRDLGQNEAADQMLKAAGVFEEPAAAAPVNEPEKLQTNAAPSGPASAAATTSTADSSNTAASAPKPQPGAVFVPGTVFVPAKPGDTILKAFDDAHAGAHEKPGYIQVREYMKHGRVLVATEVMRIFNSESQTKASDIKALMKIILES